MVDWLNEMTTDIEPADADAVIRSFDRRLRKLRSKHLLLRGKHWRTIRFHRGRLREKWRKLRVVESYADELLKSQSSVRRDVGLLLKEILSEEAEA